MSRARLNDMKLKICASLYRWLKSTFQRSFSNETSKKWKLLSSCKWDPLLLPFVFSVASNQAWGWLWREQQKNRWLRKRKMQIRWIQGRVREALARNVLEKMRKHFALAHLSLVGAGNNITSRMPWMGNLSSFLALSWIRGESSEPYAWTNRQIS